MTAAPHVVAVVNGKLIRELSGELEIPAAASDDELVVRRGGIIGVDNTSGARVFAARCNSRRASQDVARQLETLWADLAICCRD